MHVLTATLLSGGDLVKPPAEGQRPGALSLSLKVRISDHSKEADFFGVVGTAFTAADLGPPPVRKTVWQAVRCHQSRGHPRIVVLGVEGTISTNDGERTIAADSRRIGKLVPSDEVTVRRSVAATEPVANGTAFPMRVATKVSGLEFEVVLIAIPCQL